MGTTKTVTTPVKRKVHIHLVFDVSASLFNNVGGGEEVMQDFIHKLEPEKENILLSFYAYSSYMSIVFRSMIIDEVDQFLDGVAKPSGINTTIDSFTKVANDLLVSKDANEVHNVIVLVQTIEDNSSKKTEDDLIETIGKVQDNENFQLVVAVSDSSLLPDYEEMGVHPARLVGFNGSLVGFETFIDTLGDKILGVVDNKYIIYTKQEKKDILELF